MRSAPTSPAAYSTAPSASSLANAAATMPSFDQKPEKIGMPASDRAPTRNARCVRGIADLRPPIFRMSCSPSRWWITSPADMKRSALKKACVIRWKIA